MIRIAIVEDEEDYVNQLTKYLQDYQKNSNEEIDVTVYRDGDEITSKYKSQYDIILMDIQMKFVDGMTAAEEIRNIDSKVIIIFITNMTQYAIQGYKVGALDYILKPISFFAFSERLGQAIARLKRPEQQLYYHSGKGRNCPSGYFRHLLYRKSGAQSDLSYPQRDLYLFRYYERCGVCT